jgi:hypothetical protein
MQRPSETTPRVFLWMWRIANCVVTGGAVTRLLHFDRAQVRGASPTATNCRRYRGSTANNRCRRTTGANNRCQAPSTPSTNGAVQIRFVLRLFVRDIGPKLQRVFLNLPLDLQLFRPQFLEQHSRQTKPVHQKIAHAAKSIERKCCR